MKLFYADHFVLPLPPGHRFPMEKYERLRARLAASGAFADEDFRVPPAADDATLALAHCPDYVRRVAGGALTQQELRRIGFPWSPQMVERSRRSAGATLEACRAALDRRRRRQPGGRHPPCVSRPRRGLLRLQRRRGRRPRDAVREARVARRDHRLRRASGQRHRVHPGRRSRDLHLLDPRREELSLPQGNQRSRHRTRRRHRRRRLPRRAARRAGSALRGLPGATRDLPRRRRPVRGRSPRPPQAQQGRPRRARCAWCWAPAQARRIPVAIAMAGGYARNIDDTVDIHAATILAARSMLAQ